MDLSYTPEEESFRSQVRGWLEANLPKSGLRGGDNRAHADKSTLEKMKEWHRRLYEAGYLALAWPKEYGGQAMDAVRQAIVNEEMVRARAPGPVGGGIPLLGPTLITWGSEEQKRRYLPKILTAEEIWCQGYSEPGAGSDLASLKTRAELVGDEFIVNGQKVWTSGAHHADWCLCFVRTDPTAPKHKGISALIIDTSSPGVDRRPFPELSDPEYCDFNEVFFTDVRVPKENLIGPLNGGWPITQGSLAHERAMLWITYAYEVQRAVRALVALGDKEAPDGSRLGDDPRYRDAVAGFYIDAQALFTIGYRGFSKFLMGRAAPEHSLLKLYGSEALQKAMLFGAESLGPDELDLDRMGPRLWRDGSWMIQYLRTFAATIPGGTSEIQRNII